jgi:serine/threonine-protein kinase
MNDAGKTTPSRPAAAAEPPGPADLTGRTLDDFHVLRRLGQGGMGEVYLAEQVSLKRKVALKILRMDLAAYPTSLDRFKKEAENVARATHANIVQVYSIGQADGVPYMALEYVEGKNLREFLARKGPPEPALALRIMCQVAAALQRAAELGVVHRDIKPDNILLTRKGEVKVADFGLSRVLGRDQPDAHLTATGVTMGTPLYMSPEQIEGKALDARTDIYSFGVTCYHMLAGQPPFRGESAFEIALQHVRTEPRPLAEVRPDLPAPLCAVVHKMMAKDPGQRYQTGRELLKALTGLRPNLSGAVSAAPPAVSADAAAPATPPTGAARTVADLPRAPWRRARVLAGLSVVLALATGAAVGWYQGRPESLPPASPGGPVADAKDIDAVLPSPQRREQALRETVEQYLDPAATSKDVATGLGLCAKLAAFYLEHNRLEDAEKLFARLEGSKAAQYRWLGELGQALVLALRSRPAESNEMFKQAARELTGPPPSQFKQLDEPRLEPLRIWIAQALYYNARNGLPEAEVPSAFKPLRELAAKP